MTVIIEQGNTVRALKTWKNIGDLAGVKTIAIAYGHGIYDEGTWVADSGHEGYTFDVPIDAGEQLTTDVDFVVLVDMPIGKYNALVMIGVYNPATYIFTADISETVVDAIEVVVSTDNAIPEEISVAFEVV